ncbi:XRE family transcriptional regulator [Bacteroides sp. 519]|uniref:LexA family transcriptional regulator n=1 Tax=Bacteroides sp. 519 TaxID=2302937 RepID=UPI0013D79B3E|nr:XRE family transcriptional regulator [Bacteroides sp. 519]NDV59037.1 XRE family transcriptional regulator [Bacteroides sp. 519]
METSVIERVSEIIKYKGLTTRSFALKINFNYSTLNNYIVGRRTAIDLNLISKISETFDDISVEWLLTGKGHMLKQQPEDVEEDEDTLYHITKSGNKFYKTSSGKYKMRVPLVPYYAYGRYISGTSEAITMERDEWEVVDFIVDRIAHGRYLAFEIKGDSMDDGSKNSLEQGDIVLAREQARDNWMNRLPYRNFPYWIVVTDDSILCKQMIDHDTETGMVTFHSLNPSPEYRDFTLNVDEIRQLLYIVKKTTTVY